MFLLLFFIFLCKLQLFFARHTHTHTHGWLLLLLLLLHATSLLARRAKKKQQPKRRKSKKQKKASAANRIIVAASVAVFPHHHQCQNYCFSCPTLSLPRWNPTLHTPCECHLNVLRVDFAYSLGGSSRIQSFLFTFLPLSPSWFSEIFVSLIHSEGRRVLVFHSQEVWRFLCERFPGTRS